MLGAGLSWVELGAALGASVVLFLFLGGPLWRAPAGTSHVARISLSYAVLVPLAAALLWRRRAFSWAHLLGSVAILWSAKLLITASLYSLWASETAEQYSPSKPWEQGRAAAAAPARAGPSVPLSGVVLRGGAPVEGALVVDRQAQGAPAQPQKQALKISGGRYERPLYAAAPKDALEVLSEDAALHNVRARADGRTLWNLPLPGQGSPRAVPALKPGTYLLSCDSHPLEHATLVVAEHGTFARTDAAGRFTLEGQAGSNALELFAPGGERHLRAVDAGASGAQELVLKLEEGEP